MVDICYYMFGHSFARPIGLQSWELIPRDRRAMDHTQSKQYGDDTAGRIQRVLYGLCRRQQRWDMGAASTSAMRNREGLIMGIMQ